MIRTFSLPSLMLAFVLAGCGSQAIEAEPTPTLAGTVAQPISLRALLRLVAADILGGGAGAAAGGVLGSVIPGVGNATGAIVGGVICGASATVEAANGTGLIVKPVAPIDPANPLNAYDSVGWHHNAALEYTVAIVGPDGCIPSPVPRPQLKDILWQYASTRMQAPSQLLGSPELEAAWYDSLDFAAQGSQGEIDVVIQNRVKSGKMTPNEGQWLVRYFGAVNPLGAAQIVATTKSFEQEVMRDSQLTQQEVIDLLSAFSVARYSTVYWADQLARTNSPWRRCSK